MARLPLGVPHNAGQETDLPTPEAVQQRERRYIYGGESPAQRPYPLRANRRGTRRKFSTFNLIVLLLATGFAIVLYVNNVIVINRLSLEVSQLQQRYESILNVNATLQADVNKKSEWERIGSIASQQLGLRYPAEQPGWIRIDEEKRQKLADR